MSLELQFITMIAMASCGIFIGMAVDTFYRFHSRKKRTGFFHYANEILFWILQGIILFYILFLINKGEIRLYIWLAVLLGFLTYQTFLKEWYKRFLEKLIRFGIALFRFIRKLIELFIWKPAYWLFQLFTYLLTLFWAVVIWVLLIPWKIFRRPILFFLRKIEQLVPEKLRKNLLFFVRIYSKMKDIIGNWWNKIFAKRR
jgi:spore cortex biosynthesis protein YabQ